MSLACISDVRIVFSLSLLFCHVISAPTPEISPQGEITAVPENVHAGGAAHDDSNLSNTFQNGGDSRNASIDPSKAEIKQNTGLRDSGKAETTEEDGSLKKEIKQERKDRDEDEEMDVDYQEIEEDYGTKRSDGAASRTTNVGSLVGGQPMPIADSEDEVMMLPDLVIVDALFTNIDALQDQVEVCEDGLRDKLNAATATNLLPEKPHILRHRIDDDDDDDDDDNVDKKPFGHYVENNYNGQQSTFREVNDNVFKSSAVTSSKRIPPATSTTELNITPSHGKSNFEDPSLEIKGENRRRRSSDETDSSHNNKNKDGVADDIKLVQGDTVEKKSSSHPKTKSNDLIKVKTGSGGVQDDTSWHKSHTSTNKARTNSATNTVTGAQAVVSRLSARLEYLKRSLVQCYMLYKQLS